MQLYTGNGTPAEPKETMTDPLPIRKYIGSGEDCMELNNLTLEEEECTS